MLSAVANGSRRASRGRGSDKLAVTNTGEDRVVLVTTSLSDPQRRPAAGARAGANDDQLPRAF